MKIFLVSLIFFFMPSQNWGDLLKNQSDAELIEEAISRLIAEHNADPESHLAEGQALQSHKSYEIIDHLARSIVADKFEQNLFNKMLITGSYPSLDAMAVGGLVSLNYFGLDLESYSSPGVAAMCYIKAENFGYAIYNNDPSLEVGVAISSPGNYEAYIGIGDRDGWFDEYFAGFKIVNGTIYARTYNADTAGETLVEIDGISGSAANYYRIEYLHGDRCNFYINSVLVATIDTNLSDGQIAVPLFLKLTGTSATHVHMSVTPFVFQQTSSF